MGQEVAMASRADDAGPSCRSGSMPAGLGPAPGPGPAQGVRHVLHSMSMPQGRSQAWAEGYGGEAKAPAAPEGRRPAHSISMPQNRSAPWAEAYGGGGSPLLGPPHLPAERACSASVGCSTACHTISAEVMEGTTQALPSVLADTQVGPSAFILEKRF